MSGGTAGFSLLEMLVVLAILALAASLVVPRLGAGAPGIETELAARRIGHALAGFRSLAIRENRVETLSIAPGGRAVVTGGGAALALPAGATATLDRAALRFLPDGRSSGGTLVLRGGSREIAIEVDWLTGIVRLREATP